jgi:hypothetical protein
MGTNFDQIARDFSLEVAVFRRGSMARRRAATPCASKALTPEKDMSKCKRPVCERGAADSLATDDDDDDDDDVQPVYATAARPAQARSNPRFRRLTADLRRRGPRPVGEVLAEALQGLPADDQAAVLDLAERIVAFEPTVTARLGADCWPPLPIARVA